jgi:hypothetical protein
MTTNDTARLRELAAERDRQFSSLAEEAERLAKASQSNGENWRKIRYDLEEGNTVSLGLRLRDGARSAEQLGQLAATVAAIASRVASNAETDAGMFTDLLVSVASEAEDASGKFHREFPDAAERAGLRIDPTSRFPVYTFHAGFIALRASPGTGEATIEVRDNPSPHVLGLDSGEVVRRLKQEELRLFERPYPEGLVNKLFTAYRAVLKDDKQEVGAEVSLRRVMNRLSKNSSKSRPFRADEFNVDLARLIESGDVRASGCRMQVNQTRNQRQGMLLHGMEQGGYIGFVSFKEEAKEELPA